MCGRVTLTLDKETIMDLLGDVFHVSNTPSLHDSPNYNIGPSDQVLSVIQPESPSSRRAGYLTWGFVPPFAKEADINYSLINARGETVDSKPAFKNAFSHKRCIILADSFYEWKKEKTKRPFRFQSKDCPLMALAGIYTTYTMKDNSKLHTCSIITCEPNRMMKKIHNRMPVILGTADLDQWLDSNSKLSDLKSLLKPYPSDQMTMYEVSTYVNAIKNNSPKCIEPIGEQQSFF